MDIVNAKTGATSAPIRRAPLLLAALVACADYLLFRHEAGINVFLMVVGLCAALLLLAAGKTTWRLTWMMALLTVVAALPLVEAYSPHAMSVAAVGLVLTALASARLMPASPWDLPDLFARFLGAVPLRAVTSMIRLTPPRGPVVTRGRLAAGIRLWLMPVGMTAIFLFLLSSANPLIEKLLASIDLAFLLSLLDLERMTFWLAVAAPVWLLLRPRLMPRRKRAAAPAAGPYRVFGDGALIRALILFNGIFALQTLLDMAYLWGGVALPDGMAYAEYAHRGAYPLLATALLSALFVLVAMHRERTGERAPLIRLMVYAWIIQNMLLCLSSILRLELYVEAYSLTELRMAAGIWMGLVAAGLGLIMLRIMLRRPNAWLVATNLAVLLCVFHVTAYVDFAAVIARFNVDNSRELGGPGTSLDVDYLTSLGPTVIPALDRYLQHPRILQTGPETLATAEMRRARELLALEFQQRSPDWRSWTYRADRLADYLARPAAVEN